MSGIANSISGLYKERDNENTGGYNSRMKGSERAHPLGRKGKKHTKDSGWNKKDSSDDGSMMSLYS